MYSPGSKGSTVVVVGGGGGGGGGANYSNGGTKITGIRARRACSRYIGTTHNIGIAGIYRYQGCPNSGVTTLID